jgi:hypothetical protein
MPEYPERELGDLCCLSRQVVTQGVTSRVQWLNLLLNTSACLILFTIYSIAVYYLNTYAPRFVELCIRLLYYLCAASYVYLAYVLVSYSEICVEDMWLTIWTGSVKCLKTGKALLYGFVCIWTGSVKCLKTGAALLYGLGRQAPNYLKRMVVRTIRGISWQQIAMALMVYALYLASPSTFKHPLPAGPFLITLAGSQKIHQHN